MFWRGFEGRWGDNGVKKIMVAALHVRYVFIELSLSLSLWSTVTILLCAGLLGFTFPQAQEMDFCFENFCPSV